MIESRTSTVVVSSSHPSATEAVAGEMAKVFSTFWPEEYPVDKPFCVTLGDEDGDTIEYSVSPVHVN